MITRKSATPKGDPLTRWMVSGSPVEKIAETNEPRSDERNWIVRRRMIGKRRRPSGLKSSDMASVTASPWSPRRKGTITTMATTTARRMPCGAPPPPPCCLSGTMLGGEATVRVEMKGCVLCCWRNGVVFFGVIGVFKISKCFGVGDA